MAKKISYIDMLRQRYPKVNATDDWLNGIYCPLDLFDSDTIDIPESAKEICNKFLGENACASCWNTICPDADKCTAFDNKGFSKEYYENYPDEEKKNAENISPVSAEEKHVENVPSETQTANTIVYINTSEIDPHPDNPRKDVGDVSELADSIKRDGIRQNLTVIPYEQKYRCLIGHRRLAAAKLAGLEYIPCVIEKADLPRNEQIAIMLAENMQRVDLTPIEEASSMQLMLDLGDTVEGVSEKTGLSKSTVYRRINPLKDYGQETVAQAFARGATFSDFEKLNNISDPQKRQEVAEVLGTNNFNYMYTSACRAEEVQRNREKLLKTLKSFAKEIAVDDKPGYKYISCIYSPWTGFQKPKDTDTVNYSYCVTNFTIELYREYTEEENNQRTESVRENAALEEKYKKEKEVISQLQELTATAEKLRHDFIASCNPLKGCTQKQAQVDAYKKMCGFFIKGYLNFDLSDKWDSVNGFITNMGMTIDDDFDEMDTNAQASAITSFIYGQKNWEIKSLIGILMSMLEANAVYRYHDFHANHCPCQALDFIYEVLCAFGYEMSDTEKQLQDGTHELFQKSSELESYTA